MRVVWKSIGVPLSGAIFAVGIKSASAGYKLLDEIHNTYPDMLRRRQIPVSMIGQVTIVALSVSLRNRAEARCCQSACKSLNVFKLPEPSSPLCLR